VTPFYFLANNIGLRLLEPAIKAALLPAVNGTALQAAKKNLPEYCHSERSEESLFLFIGPNRREIPRSARNDKINYFCRSLFSLAVEIPRQERL